MCGILYASFSLKEEEIQKSEAKIIKRGPDFKSIKIIEGQTFCHYLLHITGDKTPQPISSEGSTLIYNGEIYNYNHFGNFTSDGFSILEAFNAENYEGIRSLDERGRNLQQGFEAAYGVNVPNDPYKAMQARLNDPMYQDFLKSQDSMFAGAVNRLGKFM